MPTRGKGKASSKNSKKTNSKPIALPKASTSLSSKKSSQNTPTPDASTAVDGNSPGTEMFPKQILTLAGFMIYCDEQLKEIKIRFPKAEYKHFNKIFMKQWNALPFERQKYYIDQVVNHTAKLQKLLAEYKKTNEYKKFGDFSENNEQRNGEPSKLSDAPPAVDDKLLAFDKALQKLQISCKEAQEAKEEGATKAGEEAIKGSKALEVDNKKFEKDHGSTEDKDKIKYVSGMLEEHLEELRCVFLEDFSKTPLPESGLLPTVDTVELYMKEVLKIVRENPSGLLYKKVEEVVERKYGYLVLQSTECRRDAKAYHDSDGPTK